MQLLGPLIWSMKIVGLWPRMREIRDDEEDSRPSFFGLMSPLGKCQYIFINLHAIHCTVNLIIRNAVEGPDSLQTYELLDNVSLALRTLTTATTFTLFYSHVHALHEGFTHMNKFKPFICRMDRKSVRR